MDGGGFRLLRQHALEEGADVLDTAESVEGQANRDWLLGTTAWVYQFL